MALEQGSGRPDHALSMEMLAPRSEPADVSPPDKRLQTQPQSQSPGWNPQVLELENKSRPSLKCSTEVDVLSLSGFFFKFCR